MKDRAGNSSLGRLHSIGDKLSTPESQKRISQFTLGIRSGKTGDKIGDNLRPLSNIPTLSPELSSKTEYQTEQLFHRERLRLAVPELSSSTVISSGL
jgi:hypothetical protein